MANFIALNSKEHLNSGWKKATSLAFAQRDMAVAITLEELPHILPTMPIAFLPRAGIEASQDTFQLAALMSLQNGKNLFVRPDGLWMAGYIPAAYRGYPFKLYASDNSKLLLCFDEESGLLTHTTDSESTSFFDASGEPSSEMERIINFLQLCDQGRQSTQTAVDALKAYNLITPWNIKTARDGNDQQDVKGIFKIDEKALQALPAETLKELQQQGALTLAYAQLLSQHRIQSFSRLYQLHQKFTSAVSDQNIDELFGHQDDTLKFDF